MQKKHLFFLSAGIAFTAIMLLAGRVERKAPSSKKAEGICQKTKGKDCTKKETPGKMILESLPRQFILIAPLGH